ncbi:MAG: class C sortase [Mogibacterium diversum]|jgi:sortase family protein|uniref:Class C sortase n=1 Tax=Mogibacterium diversum TaxID=114527 RepID=A0A930ECM0_9FIRM|nr:class C sortase [Mogibacterium diversum]MBF1351629.1 class C sortase [Mogibacterium diversum]UQF81545.1 MAG: class C sortase [Mogibacterium diversum]
MRVKERQNFSKREKSFKSFIGIALLFIVGLSIMLYPLVSNWWNQRFAKQMVQSYNRAIKHGNVDFDKELERARVYNRELSPKAVPDAFSSKENKRDMEYEKCLNINKDSMMGYIIIPAIDVELPIFHYTNEEVFQKGAGHLCGSSLPIGGKGTHAVLSAHRGLPSAKLFTDLDLLKKGDKFYLHIMNKKMAYEVDSIKVVKPSNTKSLQVQKGKDYVTLVTCTPYGVNSHRLLVRGHRIPYDGHNASVKRTNIGHIFKVIVCILIGCGIAIIIGRVLDKRKKKSTDSRWKHIE